MTDWNIRNPSDSDDLIVEDGSGTEVGRFRGDGAFETTKSVSTVTDTEEGSFDSLRSANSISVGVTSPLQSGRYKFDSTIGEAFKRVYQHTPSGQMFNANENVLQASNTLFIDGGQYVYRSKSRGDREAVVNTGGANGGNMGAIIENHHGHVLYFDGDGANPETAYFYVVSDVDNYTDLSTAGNEDASMSGVYQPISTSMCTYWDKSSSDFGFIFGEYSLDTSVDPRIIRVDSSYTFSTVLSGISSSYQIHFVGQDPYNPGTFYAVADGDPQWYKSTDYGATWSEITGAGGPTTADQDFRTLNISFGPDYLYWARDQTGTPKFFRAERSDITGTKEGISLPGYANSSLVSDLRSFGSSRIVDESVNGILFTLRDANDSATEFPYIPMFFYNIDTGTIDRVYKFTPDYSIGPKPGVHKILPYMDADSGLIYAQLQDVRNLRDESKFSVGIDISKIAQ